MLESHVLAVLCSSNLAQYASGQDYSLVYFYTYQLSESTGDLGGSWLNIENISPSTFDRKNQSWLGLDGTIIVNNLVSAQEITKEQFDCAVALYVPNTYLGGT